MPELQSLPSISRINKDQFEKTRFKSGYEYLLVEVKQVDINKNQIGFIGAQPGQYAVCSKASDGIRHKAVTV